MACVTKGEVVCTPQQSSRGAGCVHTSPQPTCYIGTFVLMLSSGAYGGESGGGVSKSSGTSSLNVLSQAIFSGHRRRASARCSSLQDGTVLEA